MRPGYIALIFWGLSICAVYGIIHGFRSAVVRGPYTYHQETNPIAFSLVMLSKVFVIGLAVAETLYAFGLIDDPIVALNAVMPFHRRS
jgi:hypothetical protein